MYNDNNIFYIYMVFRNKNMFLEMFLTFFDVSFSYFIRVAFVRA